MTPHAAAALSYVLGFITGIYFYVTSKDAYVRFHAMQSTVLSVALIVLSIILGYVPVLGALLSPLISLGTLILVIVLIIKAYHGEKYKLPYIGDFAEKKA
ncbi:MAG: DUF4870 domain-containing protein [Patescibacteria group bacterium]|nr:DUF4870 domain-containing protein [Patescibacteria group bacterium]